MKRNIASSKQAGIFAVLTATALLLTACGGGSSDGAGASAAPADGSIAEVAALVPEEFKSAPIENGFYNDYPPHEFLDGENLVGIQKDMVDELAKVMGVKVNYVSVGGFDTLIPGIVSGRYDMSSADFGVTKDRLAQVDFVTQFAIGTGFAVKKGSDIKIAAVTDLCGHSVGVIAGSYFIDQVNAASEECTTAGLKKIDLQTFPNDSARIQATLNGRVEITSTAQDALGYSINTANLELEMQPYIYSPTEQGIIVPKGSGLGPALHAAMKEIVKNGTYLEVLKKWGVESVAYSSPENVLYLTKPEEAP